MRMAVDFMESGWDVKRMVREIVTSATYRQSSAVTPQAWERDRDNRLLARGPRGGRVRSQASPAR